jgi:hypothetical protein
MLCKMTMLILAGILLSGVVSFGQDTASVSTANKILNFPSRLFNKIQHKTADLDQQLEKQTEKYLQRMAKREAKLQKELYKQDSNGAKYLFLNNPEQQYAALAQKLKTDTSRLVKPTGVQYLPYADSLQGAVSFLNKNPQLVSASNLAPGTIQNSVSQIQQMQAKMMDAEYARQFIVERKEQIKQYLLLHAQMAPAIGSLYNDYNKQLYYYTAQVNAYKEMLNDPDKMLQSTLQILDKLPAFTAFMQKNSFLSGLFDVPADYNMENAMPGMQTRDMVNQLIQNQVSAGGPNAAAALSQSLQSVQGQLEQLKAKISSLGSGGANADLPPGFKPNTQQSKTILQRLVYNVNVQTTHSSNYFPTTTDLGFSVGYKLNDKNTIGAGASYKIGFGQDISHIQLSGQGASLRSYMDILLKKGLYATSGYEYNYQPLAFSNAHFDVLSSWQRSGLIGVSKTISMNTKFFKETKVQLLWDFLSYQQVPKAQPFKFRVGYNF